MRDNGSTELAVHVMLSVSECEYTRERSLILERKVQRKTAASRWCPLILRNLHTASVKGSQDSNAVPRLTDRGSPAHCPVHSCRASSYAVCTLRQRRRHLDFFTSACATSASKIDHCNMALNMQSKLSRSQLARDDSGASCLHMVHYTL